MLNNIIFRGKDIKLERFSIITGKHGVGKTDFLHKIETVRKPVQRGCRITEHCRSELILETMKSIFPNVIKTEEDYPMHYDRSIQYLCDSIIVLKRLLEKVYNISVWRNVVPILHYTLLPAFFGRILCLANAFDIQLIFTTQSMDVIKAFQQAAVIALEQSIILIRLDKGCDETFVTTFNTQELAVAMVENMEVR